MDFKELAADQSKFRVVFDLSKLLLPSLDELALKHGVYS